MVAFALETESFACAQPRMVDVFPSSRIHPGFSGTHPSGIILVSVMREPVLAVGIQMSNPCGSVIFFHDSWLQTRVSHL